MHLLLSPLARRLSAKHASRPAPLGTKSTAVFIVPLQFLRRHIPRRARLPENAAVRPRAGIGVEQTGGYEHVLRRVDLVRHPRPALSAERHRKSLRARQIEPLHQRVTGQPFELRYRQKCIRRVRAATRFLAAGAVAIAKRREGWGDFEFDGAAEAGSGDWRGWHMKYSD